MKACADVAHQRCRGEVEGRNKVKLIYFNTTHLAELLLIRSTDRLVTLQTLRSSASSLDDFVVVVEHLELW